MYAEHHRVVVVLSHRLLPALSPSRRAGGYRVILNGTSIGVHCPDVRPTDEPDRAVVKVFTREVIDKSSGGSRCHERINDHVLIEKRCGTAHGLVGVIPADRAPGGR